MSETAAPGIQHTAKVTDAGPGAKKVAVVVPATAVAEKLKESFDSLASQAQLPGFRPGHAPRKLIEKRFGAGVRDEAKKAIVASVFQQVVEEHKLKIVGDPAAESLASAELVDGKDFAFDFEVEVMPEFELPPLDGIDVKKPILEIPDAMVEDEVRKLQISEGALEERQVPEPGDYLTGHAVMKSDTDGTEFYNLAGAVIQAPTPDRNGKGMILGVMVEDFEKQVGLPKPGETVTVKVVGPAGHEVERLRNVPVTITFKVDRVDRIIPAPLEKLLEAFGMQFADQLRTAIREKLAQRVAVQQQVAMRQQIARHLIEKTSITLPPRMTAAQSARALERRRLELMYQGVAPEKIEEHMAELRAATGEGATRELKLFFILGKAAEDLSVTVDQAEINARIAQIARERNIRPERLRQELMQRNQVVGIWQQIREHKTMDAILAKATVTEMPAEEFNKQFGGPAA